MKVRRNSSGTWLYLCPCGDIHALDAKWTFNGDTEKPTFSPSVLVRSGHYAPHAGPDDCWCTYKPEPGETVPFTCYLCHSFVRDGMVEFLGDCTHGLKGQTAAIPDWPYDKEVADGSQTVA